jgi:hypothetical protein
MLDLRQTTSLLLSVIYYPERFNDGGTCRDGAMLSTAVMRRWKGPDASESASLLFGLPFASRSLGRDQRLCSYKKIRDPIEANFSLFAARWLLQVVAEE